MSVVDLQKSNYSAQHYLNIGFFFRDLGELPSPQEHQCHVRTRACSEFPDHEPPIERLLDLTHPAWLREEHEALFDAFVRDALIPLCSKLTDRDVLKRAILEGDLRGGAVMHAARELAESK